MKKLLITLGVFCGLFILAAIAVPFFVNVDQYRPQLIQAASEHLNGKVEIGKLSLSLWGKVHVQIGGLKVSDAQGKNILSVQEAYFHLPFFSILDGSPTLILKMDQPIISVTKEKSGKFNVMSLAKTTPSTAATLGTQTATAPQASTAPKNPTTAQTAAASSGSGKTPGSNELSLPGIVTRARVGLEIKNAQFTYKDETSGLTSETKNLNLIAHDISLSHKMSLEVFADLDTEEKGGAQKEGTTVKGPIRFTLTADPKVIENKVSSVDVAANFSLDDLVISVPGLFQKDKGIPAHADLTVKATPDSVSIDKMTASFYNARFEGSGVISNFAPATESAVSPNVNFTMKSNSIELAAWSKLIPMLKQYDLGGNAELNLETHGPADKLGYKGLFKINNLTAKAPDLKAEPKIDLVISLITDQIDNFTLSLKAPGNDLSVHGKVVGFNSPHIDFQIASNGMDLDQLINMSSTGSASASTSTSASTSGKAIAQSASSAAEKSTAPAAQNNSNRDLDASLDSVRTNKILQTTVANIGVNLKSIKAKDTTIRNLNAKLTMHDLIVAIDAFSMEIFGGSIKTNMSLNLRPKAPTYKLSASVAGLDMKQAVESQMAAFKNTVMGTLNFDMSGEGSSFNSKPATHNLVASGKLKIQNATFATVDVGKMVADGLNGTLGKLAGKIPGLNGKPAPGAAGASKYDLISSSFTIKEGHFDAPDFTGKATANQGIDLKGSVAVGLEDYSLKADWTVIDTYNLTHAKEVGVNAGGISAPHILASGNGPVQFPISIGCTLMAPCYSYTQASDYLLKVAMGNVSGGAKSAAVGKAKDLLKGLVPGGSSGNASNGNALQGLKKLFGN